MQRHRRTALVAVAVTMAAVMTIGGAQLAGAAPPPAAPSPTAEPEGPPNAAVTVDPIASGLIGPLHLDAQPGSPLLVSQAFAGTISRVRSDGTVVDLVSEPGNFLGGVAAGPFGSTVYLSSGEAGSFVKIRGADGRTRNLADLGAFEQRRNPDAGASYGLQGLSEDCLATLPDIPGLAPYTGIVESNPYELALTPFGVLVADAAANDVLLVGWAGDVRVIAVLPPRPATISADAAEALGLDACVTGATLNFEPVPTDVEIGRNLLLYVSSLPGGPEDPGLVPLLGARGSVFRVNPFTGATDVIGTGFAGATNLAVAPSGAVYVAELFAGRVSQLVDGAPRALAELNEPAALEWRGGGLFVSTDVNGNGAVQRLGPPLIAAGPS